VSEKGLRIDESTLTDDSFPVQEAIEPVAADASLGDRFCMAYSGTLVARGQGSGLVVATGRASELGRIDKMLVGIRGLSTPLVRQMDRLGRAPALAILAMAAATFLLGTWWRGHTPAETFLMAVALAASAIPGGLPAIMTVALALGVQRMARRNAIVRHLPAVETPGSVTVI
ncbi:MAG: cation-transporting P-type ATPase, partial [Burkholderiales bacterium]|nr:cation-transporting P-type ATPase [Burkholderiales bacterium]